MDMSTPRDERLRPAIKVTLSGEPPHQKIESANGPWFPAGGYLTIADQRGEPYTENNFFAERADCLAAGANAVYDKWLSSANRSSHRETPLMRRLYALIALGLFVAAGAASAQDDDLISEKIAIEIKKLGGTVERDPKSKDKTVVAIDLAKTKVVDGNLEALATKEYAKGLTDLKSLNLRDTKITDNGLAFVKGYENLEHIFLDRSDVTEAGLKHLKDLGKLKTFSAEELFIYNDGLEVLKNWPLLTVLDLRGTKISDRGLEHVAGLTKLERLNLSNTKISDDGLSQLKNLIKLQYLFLEETYITDDGMPRIKPFYKLAELDLRGTRITDKGLVNINKNYALQVLRLNGTKVSDKGLEHLKELNKLRELYVNLTDVTAAGAKKLQKDLTQLKVVR